MHLKYGLWTTSRQRVCSKNWLSTCGLVEIVFVEWPCAGLHEFVLQLLQLLFFLFNLFCC